MIVELLNAKWYGELSVVSAYIQTVKANTPKRRRSRITKEHNYKFQKLDSMQPTLKTVEHHPGVWREVESVTLEDLKALQTARVGNHRPKLIEKLASYGANNLRGVDEKYYRDYYRYLLTLNNEH